MLKQNNQNSKINEIFQKPKHLLIYRYIYIHHISKNFLVNKIEIKYKLHWIYILLYALRKKIFFLKF